MTTVLLVSGILPLAAQTQNCGAMACCRHAASAEQVRSAPPCCTEIDAVPAPDATAVNAQLAPVAAVAAATVASAPIGHSAAMHASALDHSPPTSRRLATLSLLRV